VKDFVTADCQKSRCQFETCTEGFSSISTLIAVVWNIRNINMLLCRTNLQGNQVFCKKCLLPFIYFVQYKCTSHPLFEP